MARPYLEEPVTPTEHTAETVAKAGGVATVVFAGLTAQQLAALVGIVVTIAAFTVTWIYQHKRYQLLKHHYEGEEAERAERMERARREEEQRQIDDAG